MVGHSGDLDHPHTALPLSSPAPPRKHSRAGKTRGYFVRQSNGRGRSGSRQAGGEIHGVTPNIEGLSHGRGEGLDVGWWIVDQENQFIAAHEDMMSAGVSKSDFIRKMGGRQVFIGFGEGKILDQDWGGAMRASNCTSLVEAPSLMH